MTTYAVSALQQLRENSVAQIHTHNQYIQDIDALLIAAGVIPGPEKVAGLATPAPELVHQPEAPGHYSHTHFAMADGDTPEPATAPPTPTPAPPYDNGGSLSVDPFADAPLPEAPSQTPWDAQVQQEQAPVATPTVEKKSGRRTNEEIAEDHGVTLDAVKTWLGPEGGRVTVAKIKEFAELHPAAVALPGGAEQPSLLEQAVTPEALAQDASPFAQALAAPPAEPQRPAAPTAAIPEQPQDDEGWGGEEDFAPGEDWQAPEDPQAAVSQGEWKPF